MNSQQLHTTVLLEEAVDGLNVKPDGIYIDGTFGRGGHSRLILQKLGPQGRLIAIDRDPQAALSARDFADDPRFEFIHQNFASIGTLLHQKNLLGMVDGLLLDLGVSSPQLDQANRGFSFVKDGPLDMRMDTSQGISAAQWLAKATIEQMKFVFKCYGEEKFALRIARAIEQTRQHETLVSTLQLAKVIDQACPVKDKFKHPATRTFQAIRIYLNDELGELEKILALIPSCLSVSGRMSVISFHSLEDRLVKRFIKQMAKGQDYPKGLPIADIHINRQLKAIGKAIKASTEEVSLNRRSRSAVLRIAEKL